jgi:hypothetical protein
MCRSKASIETTKGGVGAGRVCRAAIVAAGSRADRCPEI